VLEHGDPHPPSQNAVRSTWHRSRAESRGWLIGGSLLNALMFGNNERLGRLIDVER